VSLLRISTFVSFVAIVALPSCPGCPPPVPGGPDASDAAPPPTSWIDCTKEAVRERAISLIAPVNDCLVSMSWEGCLLALINPVIGVTEDVLACVIRARQVGFAESAAANPKDTISVDGAKHATEFIKKRGYSFERPGDGG
jgi:hypothetical protein